MIFTFLGSVLGFATSFAPSILDYFQDSKDKKHELEMLDRQTASQIKLGEQQLQATVFEGEYKEIAASHEEHKEVTKQASQWVINMSASVRPVITYAFFLEFVALTIAVVFFDMSTETYNSIWSDATASIFSTIISFWFGQRLVAKWKKSKDA